MKLLHLVVIVLALIILCALALSFDQAAPSYAGGPEATPTCDCSGSGVSETPVPDKSSIVGYVYDYSTGPAIPRKDVGVKITGCSWEAVWGTDDNGYFYFNNLGAGKARVNLQLPPYAHPLNPDVIVETSGMTQTYTVYLGFYLGETAPKGPFNTPDGMPLSGLTGAKVVTFPSPTPSGAELPNVGGVLPDSYLVIALSAVLLALLPLAGATELVRLGRKEIQPGQD